MAGHGRPDFQASTEQRRLVVPLMLAAALALVSNRVIADPPILGEAQSEAAPGNPVGIVARPDACINDVTFIDRKRGWAVGDCGVIWHTSDGGEHWEQQSSGVDCRLESVQFLDAENGWAAGGFAVPYTHLSIGVILHTTDGGLHWAHLEKLLLSALHRASFSGASRGWAIADGSSMHPYGIFLTENGGREWTPIAAEGERGCVAGDFFDSTNGAVVSSDGRITVVEGNTAKVVDHIPQSPDNFCPIEDPPVHRLRISQKGSGWIVGGDGLVYRFAGGMQPRETPRGEVPEQWSQFDFRAIAVRGPNVWIAGSPGTLLFHSGDDGKTWAKYSTGRSLPISALTFSDDQHGWAVGALGTILATDDGGQTWRRQRSGGDHAALMGIFSDASDVPLELFAKASGSDGYLSVVELLNRRDLETPSRSDATLVERADEALVMLGAQGAICESHFPLRQRGLEMTVQNTTAVWDQIADGKGLERLEARLVRQIRTWRPEVIVVSDADGHVDPVRQLIQKVILQAIDDAADPNYACGAAAPLPLPLGEGRGDGATPLASPHPNPLPKGEGTWHVKRVYAATSSGLSSAVTITSGQLAPRLGRSLAEATSAPRGVLFDEYQPAPEATSFRLLRASDQPNVSGGDLLAGLELPPGSGARRTLAEPSGEAIDSLRRAAAQRRNLQAILKHSTDSTNRWLAQIGPLTAGLDESSAAEILFQLGWRSYRTGQWEAAAQAFELLSTQYPKQSLSSRARLWLLQYYASGVAARRVRSSKPQNLSAVLPAAALLPIDPRARSNVKLAAGSDAVDDIPNGGTTDSSARASQAEFGREPPAFDALVQRAVQLGQQIERTDPMLFAEPTVRFPLAAAYRKLGMSREAEHCLANLRFGAHDAWWSCAEGEHCLAQNRGVPPQQVWHCTTAAKHPRLDGVLDDPAWQKAPAVELRSALHDDADWPASAMLTHDQQFLYLAVRCRQAPEIDYAPAEGPRPRSTDLGRRDRIDLLLCPDRDYATWFRISIDHRGWVNTACWGDTACQPTLFVAAATIDNEWTVEAAIPWSELVDRAAGADNGQPWSANIQRIIPGVGFQSWSAPATIEIRPEGFGYLEFE